jgi:DNA-binding NarL/FixJ family response regulator
VGPYRIVLADDHVIFRQGIKRILEPLEDLEVVGEAGDGLLLIGLLKDARADMVILDISMPNLRGLEAALEVKAIYPDIKVLFLTMHREKEYLHRAMSAGADGYMLKEDADTELFSAINTIRQGGTYISPLLSLQLTDLLVQKYRSPGLDPDHDPLTTREKEIVKLIAEGKSGAEIAGMLYISVRTVQHHRANIMRKLGIKKTADLIKYAISKGYTAPAA